jgi:hypothetical protein
MNRISPATVAAYETFLKQLTTLVKAKEMSPAEAELQRKAWTPPALKPAATPTIAQEE